MEPVSAILTLGLGLVDKIWPDPSKQAEEKRKLLELHQRGEYEKLNAEVQLLIGQMKINMQEAKHKSIFVAGWRPFVGWVCGVGLGYAAILEPLLRFGATMYGYEGDFPVIDTSITLQVLMGMLGLGIMRTREKEKKVNSDSLGDK